MNGGCCVLRHDVSSTQAVMAAAGPLPVVTPIGNPDRPSVTLRYSAEAYWDRRYGERVTEFDWFFSYEALGDLIRNVLGPARGLPCLHVGCGNSTIQEGMATDGFVNITNVDISQVVIDQLRLRHDAHAALHYEVMDCRDMHVFPTGMFGGVVDKGTLDAVLCAQGGTADVSKYLKEVDRVLAPGGVFLLVSLGAPQSRQAVIAGPEGAGWTSEVVLLPKPKEFLAGEAAFSGRDLGNRDMMGDAAAYKAGVSHKRSKHDPLSLLGPFDMEHACQLLHDVQPSRAATQQHDFFFAYVCRKPGQLVGAIPEPLASSYQIVPTTNHHI